VFLGTPEAAVPSLRTLAAAGTKPVLVVAPPDKVRGRGGRATACATAAAADILGIPVLATPDVNSASAVAALHARRPDLLVVVAFGQILRREILELPRLGALNLHFSLLPRWRGAAPVQRALEAGDETTGVTVQRVAAKVDSGAVVARREVPVEPGERAGELEARLADIGAALLADVVAHVADSGTLIEGKAQDASQVTMAKKVHKEEGRADFALAPAAFCARARALHPWPLVHAEVTPAGRKAVSVALHRVLPGKPKGVKEKPGTVVAAGRDGIEVAAGGGSVVVTELQRPGGKVLAAEAFLHGLPVKKGDLFA
jgi:methionyl-tRNA formyltransferase